MNSLKKWFDLFTWFMLKHPSVESCVDTWMHQAEHYLYTVSPSSRHCIKNKMYVEHIFRLITI